MVEPRERAEALLVDAGLAGELAGFVEELRGSGVPVGVEGSFDAGGAVKPTREFFAAACVAVGRPAARCLYVDTEDRPVRAARAAGLSAYRWSGPADLPYLRAALNPAE